MTITRPIFTLNVDISTVKVDRGRFPSRMSRRLLRWAGEHQRELMSVQAGHRGRSIRGRTDPSASIFGLMMFRLYVRCHWCSANCKIEVAAVLGLHDVAVVHVDVTAFRRSVFGVWRRLKFGSTAV